MLSWRRLTLVLLNGNKFEAVFTTLFEISGMEVDVLRLRCLSRDLLMIDGDRTIYFCFKQGIDMCSTF